MLCIFIGCLSRDILVNLAQLLVYIYIEFHC